VTVLPVWAPPVSHGRSAKIFDQNLDDCREAVLAPGAKAAVQDKGQPSLSKAAALLL
jgi:hypothetical protein